MTGAEAFVERWSRIWRDHDGPAWPDLLHEGCVLRNPLGDVPRERLPAYMASLLATMPDHVLTATRWGPTGDGVLIEWVMTGTLPGGPVEISGCDRFTLQAARATDGVAYFDPRPMLVAMDARRPS